MTGVRRRRRFRTGLYVVVATALAGMVVGSTTLLASGIIALGYFVSGAVSSAPTSAVEVRRRVDDDRPRPGQQVAVAVTVANAGSSTLPEVRVRDAVPPELELTDGSHAHCTSLRPDEEVTFTYTVRARRGHFEFGDPSVVLRNALGTRERRPSVRAETTLSCRTHVESVQLDSETAPDTGQIETDTGGEGVEFFATRDYAHGDPLNRVDWNRVASTGEFRTIEFRETRAATVVVVLDATPPAVAGPDADEPTGYELARYATLQLVDVLLDDHNRVGAAIDSASTDDSGFKHADYRYLAPGAGHEQSIKVRRFFEGERESDVGVTINHWQPFEPFRKRLPENAQVVYCSPMLDDGAVSFVEQLRAHGHAVTVVSPDPTDGETVGDTVARLERDVRLRTVRERGVRTVDWQPVEPLDESLSRAEHRWSR